MRFEDLKDPNRIDIRRVDTELDDVVPETPAEREKRMAWIRESLEHIRRMFIFDRDYPQPQEIIFNVAGEVETTNRGEFFYDERRHALMTLLSYFVENPKNHYTSKYLDLSYGLHRKRILTSKSTYDLPPTLELCALLSYGDAQATKTLIYEKLKEKMYGGDDPRPNWPEDTFEKTAHFGYTDDRMLSSLWGRIRLDEDKEKIKQEFRDIENEVDEKWERGKKQDYKGVRVWTETRWFRKGAKEEDFYPARIPSPHNNLIACLIEREIDPRAAAERYEELKRSALWDSEKEMWRVPCSAEDPKLPDHYNALDQLLGLLSEYLLGGEPKKKLRKSVPPIPIVRKF